MNSGLKLAIEGPGVPDNGILELQECSWGGPPDWWKFGNPASNSQAAVVHGKNVDAYGLLLVVTWFLRFNLDFLRNSPRLTNTLRLSEQMTG